VHGAIYCILMKSKFWYKANPSLSMEELKIKYKNIVLKNIKSL